MPGWTSSREWRDQRRFGYCYCAALSSVVQELGSPLGEHVDDGRPSGRERPLGPLPTDESHERPGLAVVDGEKERSAGAEG